MMDSRMVKRVTAIAPMIMSLIALAVVIEGRIEFGDNPPGDEGWQAHIFQIMMVAQVPLVLVFVATCWRSLKQNLPVLAAQIILFVLAVGAVGVFFP